MEIERVIKELQNLDPAITMQFGNGLSRVNGQVIAALDYYNLHDPKKKDVYNFVRNYLYTPLIGELPELDKAKDRKRYIEAFQELEAELPEFQRILDKAIARRRLSDSEMAKVNEAINYQEFTQEENGIFIQRVNIAKEFLDAVYSGLISLNRYPSQVRRCAYADCRKLFLPYESGPGQRYCSTNCRVKEYRRKKELATAE